jgi:hypothetical protein
MGDVSKIAAVRVDGGPEFAVTISSDALCSRVTLCGELDLASAPDLHQVLDRLCRDGFPEIVIDLSGLEFLNPLDWRCFTARMSTSAPRVAGSSCTARGGWPAESWRSLNWTPC